MRDKSMRQAGLFLLKILVLFAIVTVVSPLGAVEETNTAAHILAIAWHPDEELIAYTYYFGDKVCSDTNTKVYLIEAATGSPVSTFSAGRCTMESLDWSPDGKKLAGASGDKTGFRVWDIATGALLLEGQLVSEGAISIRWHPTRDLLLVGGVAGDAYLFDADNGELIERGYGGSFSDWDPSGNHFLTGSYNTNAYVMDAISNEIILTLSGHTAPVGMVDWSPDGTKLASSSSDGTLRVWNAADGELIGILEVAAPYDMKWSPDSNRIAVTSLDGFVQIWDVNTEEIVATYFSVGSVLSVGWSPDGSQIAYGGEDLSGGVPEVQIVDVADIGLTSEATQEAMPAP
jgi:WD40 repeat protein